MNGGKPESILFNCEENEFERPSLRGDSCQVQKTTESIGNKLNYRD